MFVKPGKCGGIFHCELVGTGDLMNTSAKAAAEVTGVSGGGRGGEECFIHISGAKCSQISINYHYFCRLLRVIAL